MTVTVKSKTPLIVPPSVRRQAGLKSGQEIEFKVSGGVIRIVPKRPRTAKRDPDELTPEQRRIIDAQIAPGLAEVRAGLTIGPFNTHREMMDYLHAAVEKAEAKS